MAAKKKTANARRRRGTTQLNALIDAGVARRFRDYCRQNFLGRDRKLQQVIEQFLRTVEAGQDQHLLIDLGPETGKRFTAYLQASEKERTKAVIRAIEELIKAETSMSEVGEKFDAILTSLQGNVH